MRRPAVPEVRSWFPISGARVQRLPPVEVALAPSVPAWALRAVAAVTAAACVAFVGDTTAWVALGALVVVFVARPVGAVTGLVAVGAGLLLLTSGREAFGAHLVVLVFGLHLVVELTTLVGLLGWAARVERRVLAAVARPFLAIQLAAQVALVLGARVVAQPPTAGWLPPVAGIGLGVLAWSVVAQMLARR